MVVDIDSKDVIKKLPIHNNAWIVNLEISDNNRYLSGIDVKHKNHIWDVEENYKIIDVSKDLPNNFIRFIDAQGIAYFQTSGRYNLWDIQSEKIINEIPIYGKFADIDNFGNIVSVYENQFFFYDSQKGQVSFSKKHPYLIFEEENGDTIHDPYQLKLLNSKIINNKIYTVGLDKSIRVWNKANGELLDEWVANKATISGFDISADRNQLVTVDLKENVVFKDLK